MSRELMLAGVPAISFALAMLSVPLCKWIAAWFAIIAVPYSDSRHRQPTPLMGGAAIVGAVLIALKCADALPLWLAVGATGLFAVGLVDDAIVLRPRHKFLLQIAIVGLVAIAGRRFHLAPWSWLNVGLASFFLLSTINAVNLIDGLDGLASGVGIVVAAACATIAVMHGETMAAYQALAVSGALAGFLLYNFHPASIFMGDCGALPLGLILGSIALRVGDLSGNSRLPRYVVPILLMLVPLLDTAIVSVSRIAIGRPVSRRGLDHSHHRLLSLGLSDRRAVVLCWGVASVAALCAVVLTVLPHAYLLATLPIIVVAFALVALFMIDLTFDSDSPGTACGYQQGVARFILTYSYKRRLAEALLDAALIPAAYFGAFLIRLDFFIDDGRMSALMQSVPWVMGITYVAFVVAGIYRGIWRYASVSDVMRFANGAVLAGTLVVVASLAVPIALSGSIAVLYVILLFNLLVASRMSFRALRKGVALLAAPHDRVLIVGAGELAEAAARYITAVRGRRFKLIGFVDDDSFTHGKLVHGRRVMGTLNDLDRIFETNQISQMLVATDLIPRERLTLLWDFASRRRLPMRRFSIRLNEIGAAVDALIEGEGVSPIGQSRQAAHGQVVA
jgi:UDP-GlcNAc:undecaprenyl-phosphate/decaprenyl-phosphate GlcNAc-1-phosphate transferase